MLHRSVAVKLLHHDDNAPPELVQRFEREAVAAAQINHPNIVALYDRGTHGHLQFLVMEHVEGTSLAQYLQRQGPLNLDRALEIAQEICTALVAAHEANVVHYDIKPSNVMLTANGSIKVVDFGIAGFTHTHTFTVAPTTALSPVGTAQYGAPEQFLDQRGDERSDLYALGGVLFALLTGEPPFEDGTPLSVIRRKLDEEPRPVAALRPDVPAPVAQLLTDLLRRDPEDRPGTAVSVRQRLTHLRTVSAGRDTGEAETESVAPPAATRKLSTGWPEAEDAARSTDAEPPKTPVSARRWTASRRVRLLAAALPISLVLAVTAVTYYSSAARHRDTTSPSPSESATAPARYLRMPDFCGYLQRNEFRRATGNDGIGTGIGHRQHQHRGELRVEKPRLQHYRVRDDTQRDAAEQGGSGRGDGLDQAWPQHGRHRQNGEPVGGDSGRGEAVGHRRVHREGGEAWQAQLDHDLVPARRTLHQCGLFGVRGSAERDGQQKHGRRARERVRQVPGDLPQR